jgi:hypothetical protein
MRHKSESAETGLGTLIFSLPFDLVGHYQNIIIVKPADGNSYIKLNQRFVKGFAENL